MDFSSDTTSVLLKQPDIKVNGLNKRLAEQELEIRQLKDALKRAELDIKKRSDAKMALLSNMNHEIRTPMNGILGMAALLSETKQSPKQSRYTQVILDASRSLFKVLSDTMDLAELENGQLTLGVKQFSLKALMDKTIQHMAPQAANKGLELVLTLDASLPETLKSDESILRKLLCAILSDAIKLTQDSHVYIKASSVRHDEHWGLLRFEISHAGSELSQHYLDNLLSGKVCIHQENDYGQHGIGTSLAISTRLIEVFGGRFDGLIEDDLYTTCWFEIPVQALQGKLVSPHHPGNYAYFQLGDDRYLYHQLRSLNGLPTRFDRLEALFEAYRDDAKAFDQVIIDTDGFSENDYDRFSELLSAHSLDPRRCVVLRHETDDALDKLKTPKFDQWSEVVRPLTQFKLQMAVIGDSEPEDDTQKSTLDDISQAQILLVEDNKVNQMVAKALLQKLGCSVVIANDGIEAIEKYLENKFDLVLMDIRMPRMDGVEATQELKKMMSGHTSTPVIALTANATLDAKEKYINLGLDDYLAKPVQAPQLKKVLQKWLFPTTAE